MFEHSKLWLDFDGDTAGDDDDDDDDDNDYGDLLRNNLQFTFNLLTFFSIIGIYTRSQRRSMSPYSRWRRVMTKGKRKEEEKTSAEWSRIK